MTNRQFRLPDLGEGLPDAEIVQWFVAAGDTVTVNQPLVEVETAKALVEIPSPFAGTVVATHGAPGERLEVGRPLVTIDAEGETGEIDQPGEAGHVGEVGEVGDLGAGSRPGRTPVLVGYGPRSNGHGRRSRRARRDQHAASPASPTGTTGMTGVPGSITEPRRAAGPGGDAQSGIPAGGTPAGTAGTGGGVPGQGPVGDLGRPDGTTAGGMGPTGSALPGPVLAKPPVRKLARDLGVDLRTIVGTGPHGTVSRADVEAAAEAAAKAAARAAAEASLLPHRVGTGALAPPVPRDAVPGAAPWQAAAGADRPGGPATKALLATARYDPASRTRRIPVTGVRRATARAMVDSAFTAPHVTEFITADVTETIAVKDRLAGLPEFAGVKLTPLLFAAKALLVAARRHPLINSSWCGDGTGAGTGTGIGADGAGGEAEIVVHDVVNLGIAVASPRGLLVPNIPDAGSLSLADLARALADLVESARAGRVSPADLRGGTITITNIGSLGVDTGTPILNPGEAAVLALGAVRPAPWVHDGELAVRTVAHLALSFDHRIVDGELGSAVLADVAAILTDPMLAVAWS